MTKEEIALQIYIRNVDPLRAHFAAVIIPECMKAAEVWIKATESTPESFEHKFRHVIEAMQTGKVIPAIKELRAVTGLGLKEAKDICDICRVHDTGKLMYDFPETRESIIHHLSAALKSKGYQL